MKSIKNIIITTTAYVVAGLGLSSCDIDQLPLNEVVYENFWTNKDDVESVVASCYVGASADGYVENLLVWGEGRSDNVQVGNDLPDSLRYLLQGSLKTTNPYCNWSAFYNVINRCNVVLHEAPKVKDKDPNYTESDYRINIAECKFLRAYSYLTLIKTFKDVPFTFDASIDDTQNFRLPQTKFEVILDSLISDIESCKNYAPRRYSEVAKNTGKVTRAAMYSLLSELYLWRASDVNLTPDQQNVYYRKCIEACDYVLNFKIEQYEANDIDGLDLRTVVDREVYGEYGYPLLAEEMTPGTNNGGPQATNFIFGDGGSFESIFELTYSYQGQQTVSNVVRKKYGSSSEQQQMLANEKMLEVKPDNSASYSDNKLFSVPSDYRSIASFYFNETNGGYNIYKYVVQDNRAGDPRENYGTVGTAYTAATRTQSYGRSGGDPNWIFYRLTEIMLFRAEAEIELARNMDAAAAPAPADTTSTDSTAAPSSIKMRKASIAVTGSSLATADELKKDAFDLISAVYRRSNPIVKTSPKYAPTQPTTYDGFHTLLMNERRREFLFEGKRYYDLVRASRRVGNTREFRAALATKYGDAGASVAIKMIQLDFMYMPVAKSEMKVNPALVQNSCYLDEQENIKN